MKKNITNQVIIDTVNSIGGITARPLPVKVSYAISKNLKKLQKEAELYDEERAKLLKRCGVKKEDGTLNVQEDGTVNIMPECKEEWTKGLNELLNIEVEIDIHEFSIEELSNFNMSVQEMNMIDFMLKE